MRRWIARVAPVLLLLAAARAETQPRSMALDQSAIRVQSSGNELIAMRRAPVTYTTLEQIVTAIAREGATRAAPVRVVRASPPEEIDYLFGVTDTGTLVLGERVHVLDASARHYAFARGHIVRSYPSLRVGDGWLWLVEVPVSRQTTVTLQLRAEARWPLEWVSVTTEGVP
jgi:hypothetical protein